MNLLLSEIAEIVGGQLYGEDLRVSALSIDTRTLQPGQLYVAIKGDNFDGNDFVSQAEQSGAVAAMVHTGVQPHIPHIFVADTRLALAELAGAWRRKANVEVVGITGSNGKTTVKEMTAAILAVAGNTLYTQGNLNNDIGVPLTLMRISDENRYAVIEMGANHHGEIAYTSRYAQADVVILNNAGAAHLEGFGSLEGVAKAKGEIIETLKAEGVAIINRDDVYFDYWLGVAEPRKTLSFGLDSHADVRASNIHGEIRNNAFLTTFTLTCPQGEIEINLHLAGLHNVKNALAATAAALALGLSPEQVAAGLATIKPVTGRLQPLVSRLGNIIIDDTYNANASSLKAGLDVLANCPGQAWLVLGMFGELGPESPKLHEDLAPLIKASGVKRVFAVGHDCQYTVAAFGNGASYFANQADLITALQHELTGTETILIKGSRAQRMENVVAALVDNFRI
ncbi:UDP-N-acetylmuramoyl-tripeptide--D-alanyl-D-alanine ligase [Methylosoma difficile]